MRKVRTLTALVLFATGGFGVMAASAAPPTVEVVMSGLDNPRGLTFGRDGALYVAEAGRGGSGPCRVVRGQFQCYGPSGAISRLLEGVQERIVTGLPSYAPQPSGAGATGPHDVSRRGRRQLAVAIGLGGPDAEAIRAFFDSDFGWLIHADEDSGSWERAADVAGYEFAANPGGGALDSNPYGLLAGAGGRIVVDAGGNSLVRISGQGNISTLGVFPSRAQGRVTDAVPTSVAAGRDDAYYVGELTGAPFFAGIARIYRVVPGQAPQVFLDGFTAVIDIAFGCDRSSLYVLQHATGPGLAGPGALIRVAPDGTRTTVASVELSAPTSLAISCREDGDDDPHRNAVRNDGDDDDDDDDGEDEDQKETIYVSNRGTSAGAGEVLRIRPATGAPVPTKLETRLSNIDDNAYAYVNGALKLIAGYQQDTGFVDVSSFLEPGPNVVRFVLGNTGLGWTYRFEIRKDGATVFSEACGQVGILGCMNNDATLGTVYDKTVTVTVP